jgi:hypothetical protein
MCTRPRRPKRRPAASDIGREKTGGAATVCAHNKLSPYLPSPASLTYAQRASARTKQRKTQTKKQGATQSTFIIINMAGQLVNRGARTPSSAARPTSKAGACAGRI